ncbi:MAG: hypothetical protein Kow0074_11800 [Candidatus Zixiibacteriota bacterium]
MTGGRYNSNGKRSRREYVGVHFKCCKVYVHAYLNRAGTAYVAYCPKCAGKMTIEIRPDGSDSRFFETT